MAETLPPYYTSLEPFREAFNGRVPILTYHKFGERPRGVRLRGLYLPTRLFEQQLKEFRDARLMSATVEQSCLPSHTGVALTIDDGFQSVHREAMPRLARWGYHATLYLVADRLGGWNDWEVQQGEARAALMTVDEVREWIAAGNKIGAHSLTHPWLTRLSRDAAREEIRSSRRKLEDLLGIPVVDFCYPYGDWNPAVRDEVEAAGYATATTTDRGLNGPESDRWSLRRITARHATRSIRGMRSWWRSLWRRQS